MAHSLQTAVVALALSVAAVTVAVAQAVPGPTGLESFDARNRRYREISPQLSIGGNPKAMAPQTFETQNRQIPHELERDVGLAGAFLDPRAIPDAVVRKLCPTCRFDGPDAAPQLIRIAPNLADGRPTGTYRATRAVDPIVAARSVAVVNDLSQTIQLEKGWGDHAVVSLPPNHLEIYEFGEEAGAIRVRYSVKDEIHDLALVAGRVNHIVLSPTADRLAVLVQ